MRFNNFIDKTLNEKVTKKEKHTALNNDNIIIGAEFEFKLDNELGSGPSEDEYDNAMKDYDTYNEEISDYNTELEDYNKETENLKEELSDAEDTNYELEDKISDIEIDIEDLNSEISDAEDDEDTETDALYDKLDELEDELDNTRLKLIDTTNLEDDITYREDEGKFEQIQVPVFDKYTYSDYIEYMELMIGYTYDELSPEYGEKLENEPPYREDNYSDFVDTVESSGILDDFPYGDYEVGEYGDVNQRIGDTTWGIESDETVTGDNIGGMEVKSPPMELPKFIPDVLDDMFDWINSIGYTDSATGFHIHMSLKKTNGIDPLKLILFMEEDYIYNIFEERRNSSWVMSVKDKLKKSGELSKKDLSNLIKKKDLLIKITSAHTDGVNILDLSTGHVEFRYMGGSNYSNMEKDVTDVISSYAYWLSLASDPEFKKKEYIKKVNRIINKSDLFKYMFNIEYIKQYQDIGVHSITKIKTDVLIDKYKKKMQSLKNVYKLDKKTRSLLISNTLYIRGLSDNIKKELFSIVHKDDKPEHPRFIKVTPMTYMALR